MANWGTSIPVPNVQELAGAANGASDIFNRYIRPEAESDPAACGNNEKLPVIDLDLLQNPKFSHEEHAKLDLACQEWGFFQLINHGVPEEIIEKVKVHTMQFFELPLEEKEAFKQLPSGIEGYGQSFITSEEQKLDWGDMLFFFTQPPAKRNMRFWPTTPPTFRDTVTKYSSALKEVASCLLRSMSKSMGLDSEILTNNTFKDQIQYMRFNYYPPCPKADKVLGLSPHSDATGLTLLLQLNDVPGLQIKKSGKWFTVDPIPGAFIVNIGDLLEMFSNGRYKSIEHRAMINTKKERLSLATFHSPCHDAMVGPLPELVKGGEKKYKTVSLDDYMKAYLSGELDGKSRIESMKLEK